MTDEAPAPGWAGITRELVKGGLAVIALALVAWILWLVSQTEAARYERVGEQLRRIADTAEKIHDHLTRTKETAP